MQTTKQVRAEYLVAAYAQSKRVTANEVTYRRACVTELLTIHTRVEVAAMLDISPQRVSEIVGGVREL